MERLLHRWMWLLDGVAIAIAAIFAAHATARWFSRYELPDAPRSLIEEYVASPEETPAKKIDAILRRHIFWHEEFVPETPSIDEWLAPRPTSLPLRLVAVMYAPRDADRHWSVAIIRDDVGKGTQPFIVGSMIRDATVDAIEPTHVLLRRINGQREVLALLEPPPSLAASGPTAAGKPKAAPTWFRDGIIQVDDRHYEIQRRTLDAWVGDLRRLAMEVRVVPETLDGKPAGVRLQGIHSEGPLDAIGLRNGDVLRAINGLDLDSPEHVIDAYLKLRAASHISIAAERAGRRIELDYDIR